MLMPVADFLDASTVAVGHVDLTKINLDAALELFRACAPEEAASLTAGVKAAAEFQRQLTQAGMSDVYLVARVEPSSMHLGWLLAAPVSAGKDPQAVLEMLSAVLPVPLTVKGNRVLLAFAGELEAWQHGDNGGVKTMLTAVAQAASPTARANQDQLARNQLIEIGLGLQNFHDTYLKFPAQASPSRDGKPLLSWRVAILPFLEARELYEQFRLDEPWDSEHNRQLIARMPAVFASPDLPAELRAKGMTTYLAPVGPGTVFGGTEGTKIASITDGTSTTVAVVEAAPAKAVVWTKPDDLAIDPKDARTGLTGQAGGASTS